MQHATLGGVLMRDRTVQYTQSAMFHYVRPDGGPGSVPRRLYYGGYSGSGMTQLASSGPRLREYESWKEEIFC